MKFHTNAFVLGLVVLAGCRNNEPAVEEAPLVVSVAQLQPSKAVAYEEFTGRTVAIPIVDIKARATGYLQKVLFADGDEVEEGQLLYQIDPRTYEADVKAAQGAVASAEAAAALAEADFERGRRLVKTGAMSGEDYDTRAARHRQTAAQLLSNKASLERAELNLGFCKVYAPISGKISRTNIQAGNLVTADQTTLTTVVSMDPIYAYFDVDEQTLLRIEQMVREERVQSYRETTVPVYLGTRIDKDYPHAGRMDFTDNRLDSTTGTLSVRGVFPNTERILYPDMSVRIRVPIGEPQPALLVSDAAIITELDRRFLFVLNEKNEVEQRPVTLGGLYEGMRIIQGGVQAGDWIVVSNLQRVRAGMTVKRKETPMPKPLAEDDLATPPAPVVSKN